MSLTNNENSEQQSIKKVPRVEKSYISNVQSNLHPNNNTSNVNNNNNNTLPKNNQNISKKNDGINNKNIINNQS